MAMACAVTSRIKLGTGITLVPERNPLILAKEVAVRDRHSNGRFVFGVGAGWNREETTMMGGDFDHRWTQTQGGRCGPQGTVDQGRGGIPRPLL